MIETMFCLVIISVVMCVTLRYLTSISLISRHEMVIDILNLNDYTRMNALIHKETYQLEFNHSMIKVNNFNHLLDGNFYFDKSLKVSFNKNGHLGKGNSIKLCKTANCKSIIFNVGSGASYAKE